MSPFSWMAAATSYATHAITRPAVQSALLAPKAPLPLLSLRGVACPPSYAVSFSGSLTPLPAHRVTCAPRANPKGQDGNTSGGNEWSTTDSANLIMEHSKLICCKLYISESRNASAIAEIDKAARSDSGVVVLSKFGDYRYNRVRYTLVSYLSDDSSTGKVSGQSNEGAPVPSASSELPITKVLMEMVRVAFSKINLKEHSGAHPRMGVIDDLSFHPLGATKLVEAASLAEHVADEIVKDDSTHVPVFLYGEAHPKRKTLGSIRRELCYYRPANCREDNKLPDILMRTKPDLFRQKSEKDILMRTKPDLFRQKSENPTNVTLDPERGATTVGATPFLEGYNVPIWCEEKDVPKVRDIATGLREKLGGGGQGLPKVLTVAIPRGDYTEVACLLDPNYITANEVQDMVRQIAAEKGLNDKVEKGYYTDITKDMILIHLCSRTCQ